MSPCIIGPIILLPVDRLAHPSVAIISQQHDGAGALPKYPISKLSKNACARDQGEGTTIYIVDNVIEKDLDFPFLSPFFDYVSS